MEATIDSLSLVDHFVDVNVHTCEIREAMTRLRLPLQLTRQVDKTDKKNIVESLGESGSKWILLM
jgi:hypothetical protein